MYKKRFLKIGKRKLSSGILTGLMISKRLIVGA